MELSKFRNESYLLFSFIIRKFKCYNQQITQMFQVKYAKRELTILIILGDMALLIYGIFGCFLGTYFAVSEILKRI